MKKPKKLYKKGYRVTHYTPDKSRMVVSTGSNVSLVRQGYVQERTRKYLFEAFLAEDGKTSDVFAGDLYNMTAHEAFETAQWFSRLGDWLAEKDRESLAEHRAEEGGDE